jgi:hypothetical protein
VSHSFEHIDYSVRRAKYAERRMLRDIFRRLRPFGQVEDYEYIGLGSVWFSDFLLFHRSLGIKSMISIEKAEGAKARFEYNRPFHIDLRFGHTSKVLPKTNLQGRKVIWLDYDDALRPEILRDVRTVALKAGSGSLLAVTVRCSASRETDQFRTERAEGDESDTRNPSARFMDNFSDFKVRDDIIDADLEGYVFGRLSLELINEQVDDVLSKRKATDVGLVKRLPVCSFEYADGAQMTTAVMLFVGEAEEPLVGECDFQSLDFIDGQDPVYIDVPNITPKEFRDLEQQLPLPEGAQLDCGVVPPEQVSQFVKFYRYLPNYAVIEN